MGGGRGVREGKKRLRWVGEWGCVKKREGER